MSRLKNYCSPNLLEEIRAIRCLFMIRLGENENVENLDKSQIRAGLLATAEMGLRTSLKQLQVNYEVSDL